MVKCCSIGQRVGGKCDTSLFVIMQRHIKNKDSQTSTLAGGSNYLRECWWMEAGKTAYQFLELLIHLNTLSLLLNVGVF